MALISPEKALAMVANFDHPKLRKSVSDAFLRGRFVPTGVRGDDQPEDLYIALIETSRRQAIVEGCIDVLTELAPALFAPIPTLSEQQLDALCRLMALIGIAHPVELQAHTQSILQLVLKRDLPKKVRNPIVRAAIVYARTDSDAKFWEPLVGENLIPGYAFKALLQIDPRATRVKSHLIDLWKRKLRGELSIEVAPLTEDASKARGGDQQFIADVIRSVSNAAPDLREVLQYELKRYPWSASWAAYAQSQTVPNIKHHFKRRNIRKAEKMRFRYKPNCALHKGTTPGNVRIIGAKEYSESLMAASEKYKNVQIAAHEPDNYLRLTRLHETQPINKFDYGNANRGTSIRHLNHNVVAGYKDLPRNLSSSLPRRSVQQEKAIRVQTSSRPFRYQVPNRHGCYSSPAKLLATVANSMRSNQAP